MCHQCILHIYQQQPYHRIEVWQFVIQIPLISYLLFVAVLEWSFFQTMSLKSLGLHIQLGHRIGLRCTKPTPTLNNDLLSLTSMAFIHWAWFCGCETAQLHITQLLQVSLFPTTTVKPKTTATFWVLEYFLILSFESKASTLEFYHTVVRLTDNTGIHTPKVHSFSNLSASRLTSEFRITTSHFYTWCECGTFWSKSNSLARAIILELLLLRNPVHVQWCVQLAPIQERIYLMIGQVLCLSQSEFECL